MWKAQISMSELPWFMSLEISSKYEQPFLETVINSVWTFIRAWGCLWQHFLSTSLRAPATSTRSALYSSLSLYSSPPLTFWERFSEFSWKVKDSRKDFQTGYNVLIISAIPKGVDFEVVKSTFMGVSGIRAVHNIRIWGLTTEKFALAAHLAIGNICRLTVGY